MPLWQRDPASKIERQVGKVPFWWHSITLPHGVVTPGHKSPELLEDEWAQLQLPDLSGRTVLDIGCWDGWFSFTAERHGAARVVGLDYRSWAEVGNGGFTLARRLLGSRVEDRFGDFLTIDLDGLGKFDIVLFLGVLYHLRHPQLGLERLAQVTAGAAYIETAAITVAGLPEARLCEFYEGDELGADPTNWWAPTPPAALAMCRAAGFRHAELLNDPPSDAPITRTRAVIRAER